MRRLVVFLIAILVALQPARAKTSAPLAAAQQAQSSIPLRGTLHRVESHDHTCYLFDTVHVGQQHFIRWSRASRAHCNRRTGW